MGDDGRQYRFRLTVFDSARQQRVHHTMLYASDLDTAAVKAREWLQAWRLTHYNGIKYDRWSLSHYHSPYATPKTVALGTHLETTWREPSYR